ncbi:MAG TPA: bile acid:sodium symporter, partial [Croceibacterium sp.]|nr:bile acid:sodium symporter [Croceibacterium sp.]
MPLAFMRSSFDPLVRLLLLAIALASVAPVHGAAHDAAQQVSNAAVFVLFLLNGLRLPRAQVLHGIGHWRLLLPLALWS